MSLFLDNDELQYLVNVPDDELNKYLDIPSGNESDIGDDSENDEDIELNQISQTQTESTVTELLSTLEQQEILDEQVR